VTRLATPKLGVYATISAIFLLSALMLGRPELVALGTPFALFLVIGLSISRPPELTHLSLSLEPDRLVEGETVRVVVEIEARREVPRIDLVLPLERGFTGGTHPTLRSLRLAAAERRRIQMDIPYDRWGIYRPGVLLFRSYDRFDLLRFDGRIDASHPIRVFPRGETLRDLIRPMQTQLRAGNHVARRRGDGIEFAELRPFVPGDRVRSIDPKVTARTGSPWVRERHPERNADVVIFLDTFSDVRTSGRWSSLERAVRASAAVADHHLARRDRVGLVSFGGIVRWLEPAMGIRHLYRIVDALLGSEINLSYAWKGIDVIPFRTLPPRSLVLAVTPLVDDRSVTALFDLRGRRFDLAVIEIPPIPQTDQDDEIADLARRIWIMEREMLRHRLQAVGIAVAEWKDEDPVQRALSEVEAFRRSARLVPA
jgi:uncharacterized protein (DUF58 family)